MKELFPAEWFPMIITMIFFLGGSSRTPRVLAIFTRPENTQNRAPTEAFQSVIMLCTRLVQWKVDTWIKLVMKQF